MACTPVMTVRPCLLPRTTESPDATHRPAGDRAAVQDCAPPSVRLAKEQGRESHRPSAERHLDLPRLTLAEGDLRLRAEAAGGGVRPHDVLARRQAAQAHPTVGVGALPA